MPTNLENAAVTTGLKRSVFIPIPKKGNAKECSNYCTIALISHASKVMLKILQARLQTVHYPRTSRCSSWIQKRQKNQRSNCQHPLDHQKSKRVPEKTSTSVLLTMLNPLTMWIKTSYGNLFDVQTDCPLYYTSMQLGSLSWIFGAVFSRLWRGCLLDSQSLIFLSNKRSLYFQVVTIFLFSQYVC